VTDEKLEQIIGKLLLGGVAASAVVVLAGGIWYLAVHGTATPDYRQFHPERSGIPAFRLLSTPQAVILTGLLLLIATPVARVVFALAGFALERDRLYVGITAIVLAVLVYSIVTGWL
jgi:uncharacterized membrane protein